MQTDPTAFRSPHSQSNRVARLAWGMAWTLLFVPTPWFFRPWRVWLLRRFGAKFGHSDIAATARVWAPWRLEVGDHVSVDERVNLYNVFGIRIGDRSIVSQGAFLCGSSHDYTDPRYPLTGGRITVEEDCWIAAEAFVGPGVTIGRGAVVGARAVVVKDVPPWTVVAGNPAQVIRERALTVGAPAESAARAERADARS